MLTIISLDGPGVQSQFDIGKEQVAVFQPTLCFLLSHALVGPRDAIVREPNRLKRRQRSFDGIKVQLPAIFLGEVVRQHRTRRNGCAGSHLRQTEPRSASLQHAF